MAQQSSFTRKDQVLDDLMDLDGDEQIRRLDALFPNNPDLKQEFLDLLQADRDVDAHIQNLIQHAAAEVVDNDMPNMNPEQQDDLLFTTLENKYKKIRKLGEGGMGEVYLVEDINLGNKSVVLKSLPPELVGSEDHLRYFMNESTFAKVVHPHIVQVHDKGIAAGIPYLVMEYVDGPDLERYCERGQRISVDTALDLIIPVIEALQVAHQEGIIHRDIKPSNILVSTKEGYAKLADFGIATWADRPGTYTREGNHPFSPLYASPEQLQGQSVLPVSDLYSMGLVICRCVLGEVPTDKSLHTLAWNRKNKWLKPILQKCLHTNPHQRYQSCNALAEALKRGGHRSLKKRLLIPATALTIILLLSLVIWQLWDTSEITQPGIETESLASEQTEPIAENEHPTLFPNEDADVNPPVPEILESRISQENQSEHKKPVTPVDTGQATPLDKPPIYPVLISNHDQGVIHINGEPRSTDQNFAIQLASGTYTIATEFDTCIHSKVVQIPGPDYIVFSEHVNQCKPKP